MEQNREPLPLDEEQLFSGVLWLNAKVLGLVLGLLLGITIFIATNWLVFKGGEVVGPHMSLLGNFFIGYTVTFAGSFVGLAYGLALGTLLGAVVGWIYNRIVWLMKRFGNPPHETPEARGSDDG